MHPSAPDTITVYPIYDRDWRYGRITPLDDGIPLVRLLAVAAERGLRVRAPEGGEVEGGPCDGGYVVMVGESDGLPIMAPIEAAPHLEPHMDDAEYDALLERIAARVAAR